MCLRGGRARSTVIGDGLDSPRRAVMSPRTWARLVLLGGLLGFLLPGRTAEPVGKGYALLVGVRDYGERATLGPLLFTENDVEQLAEVLDRPGSPFHKNVRVLTCTRGKKDSKDGTSAASIRR